MRLACWLGSGWRRPTRLSIQCPGPQTIKAGGRVGLVISNPTWDTLVYYVDLDAQLGTYWAPADSYIFVRAVRKERRYRVLPPGPAGAYPTIPTGWTGTIPSTRVRSGLPCTTPQNRRLPTSAS